LIEPSIPTNEAERLAAIARYRLQGLGQEPEFNRIASLAAALFKVPTALVSIVGAEEQCFRGSFGFEAQSTPRRVAFCGFAILSDEVMVVPDTAADPRFSGNPLVTGSDNIRFYAGAPLIIAGNAVGTLCLIDQKPRAFSERDCAMLQELAETLVDVIKLRVDHLSLGDQTSLLRSTIENIEQGLAVFDSDLRLMLWNSAFPDMFSYPTGLVRGGASAGALLRVTAERGELGPGDPDEIVAALITSLRSTPHRRLDVRRTDGRELEVWRSTMADGRFILTATDVTQKHLLARTKDEFVSTVSHELRTPLTSIVGSLGLLARGIGGALPPSAEQLVGIALNNGERLTRLINDLLDIDKLESGEVSFNFKPLDLRDLLKEAVEQNLPYAERFGVVLVLALPPESLRVLGDRDRLLQVLANLLSNAVKFSSAGETVTITCAQHDGCGRICVTDRGPGIPEAFRGQLFRRFAQADSSDRRGQQGTGLGLAITRGIVERHGGRIGFETDEGAERHGTVFYVELDLLAPVTVGNVDVERNRVLLCTGGAGGAAPEAEALRQAGFLVDVVGSATEARARLARHSYAMLLLDLILPDVNGVTFLRSLRESLPTRLLPVAVLAPSGDDAPADRAALDLVDWLTRPVEGERLVDTVRKMAGGKRSGRARILHVEDDRDVLRVVELALGELAHIDHATNLAAARNCLDAQSYDLVILDMALPDGSGLELLSTLSARQISLPVVIFSASEPDADVVQQVSRALTKSRTSVDQLAEIARDFIERNEEGSAE